jgi:hypothetical protein
MNLKFAILLLLLSISLGSEAQLNHDLKGPKRKNNPFIEKTAIKNNSLNLSPIPFKYLKGPRRKNYIMPNRRKTIVNVGSGGINHKLKGPRRKNNN